MINEGNLGCEEKNSIMGGDVRLKKNWICEREKGRSGKIIEGKEKRKDVEREEERGGEIKKERKNEKVIERRKVEKDDRWIGKDGDWCKKILNGRRIEIGIEGWKGMKKRNGWEVEMDLEIVEKEKEREKGKVIGKKEGGRIR